LPRWGQKPSRRLANDAAVSVAPGDNVGCAQKDEGVAPATDDGEELARVIRWVRQYPDDLPLVVVTIYNAFEDVVECVESLVSTTPKDVPILLIDDASPDTLIARTLQPLAAANGFEYLRKRTNRGIIDSANFAFRAAKPRDVVILNSDILLPQGWLDRLRAAAYSRSNVATVTPLTNNGVIYSVPYHNQPIEYFVNGLTLEQIDDRVRQASMHRRPVVPTAITFCTYFRRTALDVVGEYDEIFAPGYGEEVDFSQRATATGFANIIADDLFVFHKGSRSFGANERKKRIQDAHEAIINQRYPWYKSQVQDIEHNTADPLFDVIQRARGALLGNRVAVDATCINNDHVTGTQMGTVELIRALAARSDRAYHLTMIIRDDVARKALQGVDMLVDAVNTVSEAASLGNRPFDLVHRPFQVYDTGDLARLQRWATRFIVSHLDCIAFSTPKYAAKPDEWLAFRRTTRLVFQLADGVAFISQDAAEDAAQRGLAVPTDRTVVTYFGVDHEGSTAPAPPVRSGRFAERPFLLMLGTNFRHKNRTFALRLLNALVAQYGWAGNLVFAGPRVSTGGSGDLDALEKLLNPDLSSRVFDIGSVSDQEKAWLLAKASLVVYPSIYEGFGIVPFEAAARGTPALSTRFTAVGEILGDGVRYFESLDAEREAPVAWAMLADPEVARRQVAAIQARAALYTWDRVAARCEALYERILAKPSRSQDAADLAHFFGSLAVERLDREYDHVVAEYNDLEAWAKSLNDRILAMQASPLYRVFTKIGFGHQSGLRGG
jgi:glycosyltransferase involved in cell wall biosynthesis/GT2 family glycosyltransferase